MSDPKERSFDQLLVDLRAEIGGVHVDNVETYWAKDEVPPERSEACKRWLAKIEAGWKLPDDARWGYYESAEMFGVYIWEWMEVLSPLLRPDAPKESDGR